MINGTHHEVDVVVFISEVLHQLLKALFLSTHLRKNHHVFVKLQLAQEHHKHLKSSLSACSKPLCPGFLSCQKYSSSRQIQWKNHLHCQPKGSGTIITLCASFPPKNLIISANGKNRSKRVVLGYATGRLGLSQFRTGFPLSSNIITKKDKLQRKKNEIIAG